MNRVTISVVSHGHGSLLQQLLSDLNMQYGIQDCDVIVTLNLKDEDLDISAYSNLSMKVLRNQNPLGFGANHNKAFSYCKTPWFIVLNPDIRLPIRDTLVQLLRDTPATNLGAMAPLVVNSSGVPEDSVRLNLTPWRLFSRVIGHRSRYQPKGGAQYGSTFYWIAGMCMVLNADAYRGIGGFDERFFLYCEDYDLCARLYLAGYSIEIIDAVRIIHEAQRDSHRSWKHLRWHVSSLARVWISLSFWKIVFSGIKK